MARQNINIGAVANDNTGDTLRDAGIKINANFAELYNSLYGDSVLAISTLTLGNNAIIFEGSAIDNFETTLTVVDPTADRTITLPNETGVVVLDTATQTLTNKTITSPVLTIPSIRDLDASHNYNIRVANLSGNRNINLPLLTDSDTFVFANHTATLNNKTFNSPILNAARIGDTLQDSNGSPLIGHVATPSAVNYILLSNAAAGGNVIVGVDGASTNIGLNLAGKGTGSVQVRSRFNLLSELLTVGGAISLTSPTTIFNHATPEVYTLANGTTEGDFKRFINRGAGEARIQPATFPYTGRTRLTIKQHGAVDTVWSSLGWHVLGTDSNYDSSSRYYFIR
jgi:hypothetical protein